MPWTVKNKKVLYFSSNCKKCLSTLKLCGRKFWVWCWLRSVRWAPKLCNHNIILLEAAISPAQPLDLFLFTRYLQQFSCSWFPRYIYGKNLNIKWFFTGLLEINSQADGGDLWILFSLKFFLNQSRQGVDKRPPRFSK